MPSQQTVTCFNWRLIRFSMWAFLMAIAFVVTACFSLRKTIIVPVVFLPLMVPMVLMPLKKSDDTDSRA